MRSHKLFDGRSWFCCLIVIIDKSHAASVTYSSSQSPSEMLLQLINGEPLTGNHVVPRSIIRNKLVVAPSSQLIEADLMNDLMQFNTFRRQAAMMNQPRMHQAFMGGQPQSMMLNPYAMQGSPWSYAGGMQTGGGNFGLGGLGGMGFAALPFFGKMFE